MFKNNKNRLDMESQKAHSEESSAYERHSEVGDSASVMSSEENDDDEDYDDSSSYDEEESEEEEDETEDETEPISSAPVVPRLSVSPPKNAIETAAKGESSNEKKEVQNHRDSTSGSSNEKKEGNTDNPDNPIDGENGDDGNGDDHNRRPTDVNADDAVENEAEEEDKYIVDDITDISQVPPTSIFASTDKYKEKEIFHEIVPASPEDVFWVLFADNCELEHNHHSSRGDTDLEITPWRAAPEGEIGMYREMNFVSAVNNSLGPKTTRVRMTQRMVIFKDRSCYFVQNSFVSLDVMYGDTFRIQCHLIVTDNHNGTSQLVVTTGVVFIKSSMLRWKIEEIAAKEAATSYHMWAAQAREAVIDAKEKGLLRSDKHGGGDKKKKKRGEKKRRKSSAAKKKPSPIKTTISSQQQRLLSSHTPGTTTTKMITSTPFDAIGAPGFEANASLPMQMLGYVLSMVPRILEKVNVPIWTIVLFAIIFIFYVLPQQSTVFRSLQKIDKDLRYYKMQNMLFEKQVNHVLFNLTNGEQLSPEEKEQRRTQVREGIASWLHRRTKLYDNDKYDSTILRDVLYQFNDMKRTIHEKEAPQTPKDSYQLLVQQDILQRQQQQRQLDVITWSIIGLVVVSVVRIGLGLFGILK
jgi:hypothetical protein